MSYPLCGTCTIEMKQIIKLICIVTFCFNSLIQAFPSCNDTLPQLVCNGCAVLNWGQFCQKTCNNCTNDSAQPFVNNFGQPPSGIAYYIEPIGFPNCYLDFNKNSNNKIIINCNGGAKFYIVNGLSGNQGSVSFQYVNDSSLYIRHIGFVGYLHKFTSFANTPQDGSFYIRQSSNKSYVLVQSANFLSFFFQTNSADLKVESLTSDSYFKLLPYGLNIKNVKSISRHSVKITINSDIPVWNLTINLKVKCVSPSYETIFYPVTNFTSSISSLQSSSIYIFFVGMQNEFGFSVYGPAFFYQTEKEGTFVDFYMYGFSERNILNMSITLNGNGYNVTLEYFFPPFVAVTSESDLNGFKKASFNQNKYTFNGFFDIDAPITHNLTLKFVKRICFGDFPVEIPVKLSYHTTIGVLKIKQTTYQETFPCLNEIQPIKSREKNALPEYYGRGIYIDVDNSHVYVCMNQHVMSSQSACYYSNDVGNYWLDLDVSVGCVLGHHFKTKELYAIHRNQKSYIYFHGVYKKWLALSNQEFYKITPNSFNTTNKKNLEDDEDQVYSIGGYQWLGNAEGLFYRKDSSSLWTQVVSWNL